MSGFLFHGGASPLPSSLHIGSLALQQARARGLRTHIVNTALTLAHTAGVAALADGVSAVDPDSPADCMRWALDRGERFDVVMGLRDSVLEAAAHTAEVVGAPGNPPAAVRRTRNKDECREALRAAGFRQPQLRLCHSAGAAMEFLAESTGPWVVKPRDGMGSIGVRLVEEPAELTAALAELPDPELFLVEEYIDGPEFSAEGVFISGRPRVLAVTAKEKLPPPYFVELAHVLPANLPPETAAEMERQVTAALLALGLRFGVFHVELWLTATGVVLGEVHVRPGGDWLHALLGYALPGLELFGLVFDDALGRPVALPGHPVRGAATLYLTLPPGRLLEVRGWNEVLVQPDVLHADLTVSPGAGVVGSIRNSGDRAGVIVVGADSAIAARTRAGELADSLAYTMA